MMSTVKRKVCALIILAVLTTSASTVYAKAVTFTKEYTFQASEADSKLSCRTIALEQVKRLLLEELGTYLESETEINTFQLTKDQITTLTAGIVSTEVKEERWDGKTYWLRAQIIADPAEVAKSLDSLRKDRAKFRELEESRKRADDASREIVKLRNEIALLQGRQGADQIKKYNDAVKVLSVSDWFTKGYVLHQSAQYSDSIDAYSKAIELDPKYTDAYINRGVAHIYMNNYQQAMRDFDRAIELNPKDGDVYNNRGLTYANLNNYQQAMRDYGKAIVLNPKDAHAYNNRGAVYMNMHNYQQAIRDFDKSVELNPKYALAFRNRGLAYAKLGKYQQAIHDFDTAIDLNPKDADSYGGRGAALFLSGNKQGCVDFKKACELGNCNGYTRAKQEGICN